MLRCRRLTCRRVVVAAAARRRRRDVGDERRRRVQRTALLRRQPGGRVAHAGQRLVAFDRRHQVVGVVADVADVGRHRRRQQVLGEDVPLLGELRAQVRIPRAHLAGRLVERPQLGKASGQRARTGRRVVVDTADSKKNGGLSGSRRLAPVPSMYWEMP